MDDLDQFEMKPLTPGLGFHKRQVSLKEHVAKSGLASEKLGRGLPTESPEALLDASTEKSNKPRSSEDILNELKQALKPLNESPARAGSAGVELSMPLPRPGETTHIDVPELNRPTRDPIDGIHFEVPKATLKESAQTGTRRGAPDALIRPLVPVPFSFSAAILDGTIVLALSLIFLVALITVTGIDVISVLSSAQNDITAQLSLAVLYVAVLQMYAIISRSFFGKTVGEWTFDLQVGENQQISKASYPLRVLFRSLLNVLTGFVILPVLSLIFRRDLAGVITGIRLYRQNIHG